MFSATIEILHGQHAAIIALFDSTGEWSGAGRIDLPRGTTQDLYELGYVYAAKSAMAKGDTLGRYSLHREPKPLPPTPSPENCQHRCALALEQRPANALNVEIGTPLSRCNLKRPSHWPEGSSSLRWLASGGSPLVFGICSANCPARHP